MRLKIFFAPLVFLAAGIIAIWYIWPTIQDIQLETQELNSSKEALNLTLQKKDNLEVLKSMLDRNKEKEDFIDNYLPIAKNEDKIVDGLDYLATNSGLSLINVSVEEEKLPLITDEYGNVYDPNNPTTATNSSTGSTTGSNDSSVIPVFPLQTRFLLVKANVSGKYENIRMFLSQIYRMEIFNKINSLAVEKISAGGYNPSGEEQAASSDTLTATVEMKFGYLPPVQRKVESSSEIFSSNEMNFSQYQRLKESVTEKIPALDGGQKGKSNPFLP